MFVRPLPGTSLARGRGARSYFLLSRTLKSATCVRSPIAAASTTIKAQLIDLLGKYPIVGCLPMKCRQPALERGQIQSGLAQQESHGALGGCLYVGGAERPVRFPLKR